jgi:hypothetical protein
MSAAAFGALFGADRRTVARWEAGDSEVNSWVWVGVYYALRRFAFDAELINALPVPSRRLCPRVVGSQLLRLPGDEAAEG